MRKILTIFEIFSQPAGPIGKPNQQVHWVLFTGTQFGYFALFVMVLDHSELELHSVLFFWILDYVRKVLENFENFSQPDVLVGKPDLPVH